MATYNTYSGFQDLIGSMVLTGDDVGSYTSNIQGVGTVQNLGGPNLNFNVQFEQVNRPYHVIASVDGTGYRGTANNNGPTAGQEEWSATASTGVPVEESRADVAEDAAAKKAVS